MAFQHFRILLIAALILASILPLTIGSETALAVDVITHIERNTPPVVKNVTARQEPETAMVEITYDVSDEHHTAVTISLRYWDGSAWQHCESVTPEGKIPVGEGCQVYWDAGADFPEHYVTDCKIEVTADDEYTWYGEPFNNLSSTGWPEPYRSEPFSPEFILDTRTEITPPVISAVIASDITQTSAIVRWNTDEPATSQVAYSTTSHAGAYASIAEVLTAYGSWSAEDASLVMVHAVALSGLDPGTEYFYRVLSKDVYDNEAWSDEYQFETEADETPPVISAVVASDITETGAIIRWNTNEPATSQVEYGVAEAGLVLDLPMDEGAGSTAGDLSGYGNDGTIYGATWVEGISGNALSFDGVDDYVDCGSNASLDIIGGFAVEMWVRSNSVAQPIGSILGGDKGIIFYQGATDGQDNSAMFGFRGEGEVYSTDGVIDVGTWIHLAFTYDGGDKDSVSSYEIYANGINQNLSIRTDGDIGGVSTSEYIGRDQGATFFNGLIDSVRIYNRALSAEEVLEHYLDISYGSTTPLDPTLVMSHSVSLSGLDPDTTYHYRVRSMDAADNEAISDDYTFTTLPDEIAPTISGVIADNITDSGAIISWDTNEPATSRVEYGLDTSYGSTTPLEPALVFHHVVALGGLEPNTTYHYRVRSMDAAGNEAISGDDTFTTEPDTTPPQISDVITTNVGETSAIVQWLTDEPATSQVAYGTTSHAGDTYADIAGVLAAYESSTTEDTELATNHGVALSGLSSGVTIYYRVLSKDGDGNEVWSDEYSFETTDITPPALVWVDAVLITDTGAVVAWETDEDAYCQIVYSTTSHPGDYSSGDEARAAYEFSEPEETTPLLGHQAVIDGFTSGTTIYYRIISRDEAANEAVSAEYSFTTT